MVTKASGSGFIVPSTTGDGNDNIAKLVKGEIGSLLEKQTHHRSNWDQMFGPNGPPAASDSGSKIVGGAVHGLGLDGPLATFTDNIERLQQAGAGDKAIQALWDTLLNEGRPRPRQTQES